MAGQLNNSKFFVQESATKKNCQLINKNVFGLMLNNQLDKKCLFLRFIELLFQIS